MAEAKPKKKVTEEKKEEKPKETSQTLSRREANRKLDAKVVEGFIQGAIDGANKIVEEYCLHAGQAFRITYADPKDASKTREGYSDFAQSVMDEIRRPLHNWCQPPEERAARKEVFNSKGKKVLKFYAEPKH